MRSVDPSELCGAAAAAAAVCVGLAFAPTGVVRSLELDRSAVAAGEIWRLWTGHLVHYSLPHALYDAGAVLLLGHVAERCFGRRFVATMLLLVAPLMSVVLLFCLPGLAEYRGASGLATLLGVFAGIALWRSRPEHQGELATLAALFVAKLICDAGGEQTTLAALPQDVGIMWQAHLFGIVAAAAIFCGRRVIAQRS